MKLKDAKNTILYEVATNGVVTLNAVRIYSEHRISKKTFNELIRNGLAIWKQEK